MTKLVIITGQTATGKTKLALTYVKKYNGQIINCDSRQIYKYLDIITGKDRPSKTKILLYDIVDPRQHFSSYDYVQKAIPLIKKLLAKQITPIIVGGTYLYLKHLLYGIETENIPPNWRFRKRLKNKSVQELQQLLKLKNFRVFSKLNESERKNPQRLIRKIEIASFGAKRQPDQSLELKIPLESSEIKFIGLRFKNKVKLRLAVEKRVEERLKKGALEEVKKVLKKGYKQTDPGLKTIGYKEIIAYLNGRGTKENAITQWINREIQYAKRQYTFMKKDSSIEWREV